MVVKRRWPQLNELDRPTLPERTVRALATQGENASCGAFMPILVLSLDSLQSVGIFTNDLDFLPRR